MPTYEERNELIKALSNQAYFDALSKPKAPNKAIQDVGVDGQTGRSLLSHPDGGLSSNGVKRFNTAAPQDGFVTARIDRNSNAIAIDGRQRKDGDRVRLLEDETVIGLMVTVGYLNNTTKTTLYVYGDRYTPDEIYNFDNTLKYLTEAGVLTKTGEDLDNWILTIIKGDLTDGTIAELTTISNSGEQKISFPDYWYTRSAPYSSSSIHSLFNSLSVNLVESIDIVDGGVSPIGGTVIGGCIDPFASNYNPFFNSSHPQICTYDPDTFAGRCLIKIEGTDSLGYSFSYMAFNQSCQNLSGTAARPSVTAGGGGASYVTINWTDNGGVSYTETFGDTTIGALGHYYATVTDNCIRGCTSPTSANYNPLANQDNGSCAGDSTQIGCADGLAVNYGYNPSGVVATYKSCLFKPVTTSNAVGYFLRLYGTFNDLTAFDYIVPLHDWSTSLFSFSFPFHPSLPPPYIELNRYTYTYKTPNESYWLISVFYGGELIYTAYKEGIVSYQLITGGKSAVIGCTDPNALNYNPSANFEDNSCAYDPSKYTQTSGHLNTEVARAIATPSSTGMEKATLTGNRTYTLKTTTLAFTIFDGKAINSTQILLEYPQKLYASLTPKLIHCDRVVAYDPDGGSCLVMHYDFGSGEVYILRYTNGSNFGTPEKYKYSDFNLFFASEPFIPFSSTILATMPLLFAHIFISDINSSTDFTRVSSVRLIGNQVFFTLSNGFTTIDTNSTERPYILATATLIKGDGGSIGTVSIDYVKTDWFVPDLNGLISISEAGFPS